MNVATFLAVYLGTYLDAQPASAGGGIIGFLPLLLIPVLYLMLFRPQQKRQKQWQAMLTNLKSGDRVTTSGGLKGVILSLKDDSLIIRVAPDGLKLEVAKASIAAVTQEDDQIKQS